LEEYPSETIPVTIDKSHIITIGERLYAESIEFVRERVNNAYDADATRVDVILREETIEVRDNGTGMDRDGLKQYFNIGSPLKLEVSNSPVFHRKRIGQFGIGKFAALAACRQFQVTTRRKAFAARIVFSKAQWEASEDRWQLPLEILPPEAREEDGTTVLLSGLNRRFEPQDIEAKIIEGTPLKTQHFRVLLNGVPVQPRSLSGHRIPILDGTAYGPVTGEIVILPETAARGRDLGIEVKVKQLTPNAVVKRMRFGESGVSCVVDSFGEDGPEVFSEETTIYINQDHPLYQRESKKQDTHVLNLARLLTQEIALMKDPKNPRQAFERQSRLLRDALVDRA